MSDNKRPTKEDLEHMPPHGRPPEGKPPKGMPPHGKPPEGMPPHGKPPAGKYARKEQSGQGQNVQSKVSMPGPGGGPPGRGMGQERAAVKDTKKTLLRLWDYLKAQKTQIILAFIFVIIGSITSITASYIMRPVINAITNNEGAPILVKYLSLMAIIYSISVVCSYLQSRFMLNVAQNALKKLREDLYVSLQKLPLKYFDSNNNGDIMSRFTNDVDAISTMLSSTCVQLISSSITLVTTLCIMIYTNWILTIVTLIITPVFTYVTKTISKKTRVYYKEQQEAIGELNGFIEERITGQKVVKVFNYEDMTIDEFKELNGAYREKSFFAQFLSGTMGPIMGGLTQLSYGITACVGGLLCLFQGFDVGGFAIFLNYSKSFSGPISAIFMQVNTIFSALAGAERVFEVMDEEPEPKDSLDAVAPKHIKGEIELKKVEFGYLPNVPVLKGISLQANTSQKIAFVGSTGAGKTTITNLLNRFYDINSGSITIDGVDIKDYKREYLRQNIAMVLQDTHLFTGTVKENIRYGRLDASDEDIIVAAKTANAHNFIIRLENGYDTVLTGDGSNLSQGQRQLLNIARAAISKAPILVLDEATSSVDTRTEKHIEQALDRLMDSRTTFVIAHRLSTVRNSDVIIVLEYGEIIEQGSHEELLALEGKYYSLYTGMSKLD
ncbi:MAG: ABC transporter transmembrane domain-containing protein [Clostridia bacterium]